MNPLSTEGANIAAEIGDKPPLRELLMKAPKISDQIRKRDQKQNEKDEEKEHKLGTPVFNEAQSQERTVAENNALLQKAQNRGPHGGEGQNNFEQESKR